MLEDNQLAGSDGTTTYVPWPSYNGGNVYYDEFGLNSIYKDGTWLSPRQTSFWVDALNGSQSWSLDQPAGSGAFDDALGLSTNCTDEIGRPVAFKDFVQQQNLLCRITPYVDTHTDLNTSSYAQDAAHGVSAGYGTAARWRNDDDRALTLRDGMDMKVQVSGSGGIDLEVLVAKVVVAVSIDVVSTVDTMIREQLSSITRTAQQFLPAPKAGSDTQALQTNVTVTPVGNNAIGIDPLDVMLDFTLNLGFFKLHWEPTIFNLGDLIPPIRSNPAIPGEGARLRVGEFSELDPQISAGTKQGATPLDSHFPAASGGAFASMNESVAQCLAEQKQGGHQPTPKPTTPAPPAPPYGLCYYGPSEEGLSNYRLLSAPFVQPMDAIEPWGVALPQYGANVCQTIGQPGGWDANFLPGPQHDCIEFTLKYLCGQENNTENVSHPVTWNGEGRIAHLVQKGKNEDKLSQKMWGQCAAAFVAPNQNTSQNTPQNQATLSLMGSIFLNEFVWVHVCDTNTLEPVGTTPADEGHCKPDPVTHQCFSVPPCYLDAQGHCSDTCTSTTGAGCTPVPVPPVCNPAASGDAISSLAVGPVCQPPPPPRNSDGTCVDPATGGPCTTDGPVTASPVTTPVVNLPR
jgi:hypothetical protein